MDHLEHPGHRGLPEPPVRRLRRGDEAGWGNSEAGFAALWFIGLVLGFVIIAGLGLDLWRIYADRAGMAAAVDAAADAGAAQIDEAAFRAGTLALDPDRAEEAARENLDAQGDARRLSTVDFVADPQRITVRGEGYVELSLLRIIVSEPIRVEVTAVAEPRVSR
jgi:Flp pilus assembly protein TadG